MTVFTCHPKVIIQSVFWLCTNFDSSLPEFTVLDEKVGKTV